MAWSVDAEINWARFHSCRSHPRKRRERSFRVREACDLQSNRLGYLNTTPPNAGVCPRAQSLLCVASRAPHEGGADRKAKVRPPSVLSSLDIWEAWLMRLHRERICNPHSYLGIGCAWFPSPPHCESPGRTCRS